MGLLTFIMLYGFNPFARDVQHEVGKIFYHGRFPNPNPNTNPNTNTNTNTNTNPRRTMPS